MMIDKVIPHPYRLEESPLGKTTFHTKSKKGEPYAVTITSTSLASPQPTAPTSSFTSMYGDEIRIAAPRVDHDALISHAPNQSHPSTDVSTLAYHMDPFAYSADQGYQGNNRFFQAHANLTKDVFPSSATADRVEFIDDLRLQAREIENARFLHSPMKLTLSSKISVSGNSIKNAEATGGILGILPAQDIPKVYDTYRNPSPPPHQFERHISGENTDLRMYDVADDTVLVGKTSVDFRRISRFANSRSFMMDSPDDQPINASVRAEQRGLVKLLEAVQHVLLKAQKDRDNFLEHTTKHVSASNTDAIVSTWNNNDQNLQNYLHTLGRVKTERSSPIRDIAESGITAASHRLKIGLIAEERILRKIRTEADTTLSARSVTRIAGSYVGPYLEGVYRSIDK